MKPLWSRTVVNHGERDPLLDSNRFDPSIRMDGLII